MSSLSQRISCHHVGARNATGSLPLPARFDDSLINVLYEPDPDATQQIEEKVAELKSDCHVLPYALSDCDGEATLYVTYDPYGSSLLPFNHMKEFDFTTFGPGGGEYLFSDVFRTMDEVTVPTRTIDNLYQTGDISAPKPDVLTLDTQGSEYEIIEGARQTIMGSTLCLIVEVEFIELYKGQKLFGDLVKQLDEMGFAFGTFLALNETEPFRQKIGLRADGFTTSGDAIFFRKPGQFDHIEFAWEKMAFLSLTLKQTALGFHCLSQCADRLKTEKLEPLSYLTFLKEMSAAVKRFKSYDIPLFSEFMTFEDSKTRFLSPEKYPEKWEIHQRNYYACVEKMRQNITDNRKMFLRNMDVQDSVVELTLRKYDLSEVADECKKVRVGVTREYMRLAGAKI